MLRQFRCQEWFIARCGRYRTRASDWGLMLCRWPALVGWLFFFCECLSRFLLWFLLTSACLTTVSVTQTRVPELSWLLSCVRIPWRFLQRGPAAPTCVHCVCGKKQHPRRVHSIHEVRSGCQVPSLCVHQLLASDAHVSQSGGE